MRKEGSRVKIETFVNDEIDRLHLVSPKNMDFYGTNLKAALKKKYPLLDFEYETETVTEDKKYRILHLVAIVNGAGNPTPNYETNILGFISGWIAASFD